MMCILGLLLVLWFSCISIILTSFNEDNDVRNDNYIIKSHPYKKYEYLDMNHIHICKSLKCLDTFTRSHKDCHSNRIILAGITYNIIHDFMFSLFVPWLNHLFGEQVGYDVTIFLFDYLDYGHSQATQIVDEMLKTLPSCTVFLIFHCHATSISFNPPHLKDIRDLYDFKKHVIMHISHEVAYDLPFETYYNCYGNESTLYDAYRKYDLVVKQYYYEPLHRNKTSIHLPLGAKEFHLIQRLRSISGIKPINERKQLCHFSGRFTYEFDLDEHAERKEISDLVSKSLFPCIVYKSKNETIAAPQLPHYDYLNLVLDTIFMPCPAGSAVETFRLYEALELGAIPLLVKQKNKNLDFLSTWTGYPGPLLNNWTELIEYFQFLSLVDSAPLVGFCSMPESIKSLQSIPTGDTFIDGNFKMINDDDIIFKNYKFCTQDLEDMTFLEKEKKNLSRLHFYLVRLQKQIMSWYFQYKQSVSTNILNEINRAFSDK